MQGKLALVDLAGSERASEANTGGQKLRDGANINRSLLALANCINALGKQHKKGLAYVPYRNSKLTRILKDGLSGNSQTVMVATVSPAVGQYHHTVNTLKYADRAKEIKTHILKNIGTVDTHLSDYQRMIDGLQIEVCRLRKELAEKEWQLSVKPAEKAADDELSWLDVLSRDTSENVHERINLQKALFELEETNLRNRNELQHLDEAIAKQQAIEKEGPVVEALRARRQMILDNIRDNDEAGVSYQKEIEANEKLRCQLQSMIEEAISNNGNKTYLRILSQYRLLGMANTELQFEMAMRDQIIHDQREALRNLWNLLMGLGLDEKRVSNLAAKQGITIENWTTSLHSGFADRKHSSNLAHGRCAFGYSPSTGQSFSRSCFFQQFPDFDSRPSLWGPLDPGRSFYGEEHHSSCNMLSRDRYPHTHSTPRKSGDNWVGRRIDSWFGTVAGNPRNMRSSCPDMRTWNSPCSRRNSSALSLSADFSPNHKDTWNNSAQQLLRRGAQVGSIGNQDVYKETTMAHAGPTLGSLRCISMEENSGMDSSNDVFHHGELSNIQSL